MGISTLGLNSSLAGSFAPPPQHLASFLQSVETVKVSVLTSSQNIITETNEIIFIRGFDFSAVAKHQRMKIHPAIVAIIITVNNRTSKEREVPHFFCNCKGN